MKIIVVHLSGSKRGRTEVFSADRLRVGTDISNELQFDASVDRNIAPFHAEIELRDCDYFLRNKAVNTFLNSRPVEEAVLRDGDMIEFGEGGPKVRFRIRGEEGDVCKPFREMLEDSAAIASEGQKGGLVTASTFFRELVWEALTQSSLRFRIGLALGVCVALFMGISGLYSSISQIKLEKEVEHRWQKTTERIETLEARSAVAERIINDFSGGVCLIQGTYTFGEDSGKGMYSIPYEYTGTGFLISADGKILTNRHVAVPWSIRSGRFGIVEPDLSPMFKEFRAFFPGVEKPFPLTVESVSKKLDLAIVKIDTRGVELPVLKLETVRDLVAGEPVVVIGYPAGISAILARIEKPVMDELIYSKRLGFLELTEELSRRKLIRPLATQGHITDVLEDSVVFDAQTTIGGSGGPLFDRNGKVIAITYGIFTGFTGSNLAIPAKGVTELLQSPAHTIIGKNK